MRNRVIDAFVGIKRGDTSLAKAILEERLPSFPPVALLQFDQLEGLIAIEEGKAEEGIALLKKAAEAEDALPLEFGPPELVKPTFELLGEELLALGRTKEAETAFRRAVERTPRRPNAVDGFALASIAP